MKTIKKTPIVLSLIPCLFAIGCSDKFLDPTQIGRFRPVPAVNIILDSLGVAEEKPSPFEGAEDPKPVDVMVYETDYIFGPGDVVRIDIYELLNESERFINDYTITETGKISIPQVGIVEASGLTESQLEEEIRQILSPAVLKEPTVTVALMRSQKRTFSILGNAVPKTGRYDIPRYDFRLNDALAVAGVATQYNVSYIYVVRPITGEEPASEPSMGIEESQIQLDQQPEPLPDIIVPENEMMEIIAPRADAQWPDNSIIIASAEMASDSELFKAAIPADMMSEDTEPNVEDQPNDQNIDTQTTRETIENPIENQTARIEWIFEDGRWTPVQVGEARKKIAKPMPQQAKLEQQLEEKAPESFDWEQIQKGGAQTRVIEIPTDLLAGGDPRYNVVIRPGDSIHVPLDIIGEFCIMGNVNSQGYIPLTGRPMTLKMAIASAGGLGPLAWPKRCEVIRRIARNKEETVMVDLEKIANGEQPDFFIKPLDTINVGTHPTSRWRAILRNAFRATYGFGFIYDRNFADRDYGTSRPIPNWF